MVLKENELKKIWEKSQYCYCGANDCHPDTHRLCPVCGSIMLFDYYEENHTNSNSRFAWNLEYVAFNLDKENASIEKLRAVHVSCNHCKNKYEKE